MAAICLTLYGAISHLDTLSVDSQYCVAEHLRNMRKKIAKRPQEDPDLWVSPNLALRGPNGDRGFHLGGNLPPENGARFLELADIALGLKRPADKPRSRKSVQHDSPTKR
ncbi:MAG TPA: hypothetical protein VE783_02255 [Candidatus Limnocylindrales bacterium]|jgi:hypothetical protein|nr:hypothetical protein [Candidatus Limnocylindrales bacterium]